MPNQKLSEAAQDILNNIVASKRADRTDGPKKLDTSVAYGMKDAGKINDTLDKTGDDDLPDGTKGIAKATPPGATPPVGAQPDGVGATKPENQPQQTMGRTDLAKPPVQGDANNYDQIRDRIMGKAPTQTFSKNPGAHFDSYHEEIDVTEDVNALLEGESLSDEFKTKATTIFEAAVSSRVQIYAEQVEARLVEEFEAAIETVKEDLADKVDGYLNYMVEEWMKENEVAIEKGLRNEIVEDFITKLRDLFIESYIDIPEEKVDVVEELASKVDDLETALNEEIKKNIAFAKEINEHKKMEAMHEACVGLTQTQVEKVKTLAESIDFTTDDEFNAKIETIKESYFPSQVISAEGTSLNEEIIIEDEKKKSSDPMMNIYADAITKTVQK